MNMEEGGIYRNAAGGVTPPISPQDNELYCWTDGHLRYMQNGKQGIGHFPNTLNLVEYLGQAETDNGDGTTTKIVTIPVTLNNEAWATHDPIAYRTLKPGDTADDGELAIWPRSRGGIDNENRYLIFQPKTPQVNPYWIKLADAIDNGECEIPSRAEGLRISVTRYARLDKIEWPVFLGVLPELRLGASIEIDLAAFRAWYEKRGEA